MTLVIDFGAVNTVAMVDGRLVTVDGAPWLPSAVHEGVVGADAVVLGRGTAVRDLKARLDIEDVRAVFARVARAARAQGGTLDNLVLTHPAGWPTSRVRVLVEAARGLAGPLRTLAEPVAVAAAHGVDETETVLVVDAGGGTCDVAVVRGDALLAEGRVPFDLDRRIVERVRPSLTGPADAAADAVLRESARAGKELLSRHESVEIVLPDHRAVRLDRPEFERLVAGDVDRVLALVDRVRTPECTRVLLAGGASRVPVLERRLAEIGLPVVADPEPETAVVRGATVLAGRTPAVQAPTAPPVDRQRRRLWGLLASGLGLVLVAVLALGFPGVRPTGGQPTAAPRDPGPVPAASMPPPVAGQEVVNRETARFTAGELGERVSYRHPAGVTLAVTVDGLSTALTAPAPFGEAPPGFRWLRVQLRVANVEGPDWPHDPLDVVGLLDDRGQWLRPVGPAQVPCEGGGGTTAGVAAGAEAAVCGVLPVPVATPVEALVFGEPGRKPLRFPVSVLASAPRPATARVVGALGGPAVDVPSGVGHLHARFELVLTPSGYLGGRTPAPGNRFVVVRAALTATGPDELRGQLYLRDDRGAYLAGMGYAGQLPGCPAPPTVLEPAEPVYGCFVFEVAAGTPVTAVTHATELTAGTDLVRWPSWRA